ncbi:site-specific integrase [Parafrankia sp. BMG5.11]|uniref:tyrosine-type recombinase/integrase n=1 Tax=Parafrankia sp. BMG5.11 TaxID=222540 RepID=UPI001039D294|nr:site-specific integrase [Parafrankia sp. BMG5.11]TCJ39100.1 site-specific integrase [Parafrankia sp. BMG5.11]
MQLDYEVPASTTPDDTDDRSEVSSLWSSLPHTLAARPKARTSRQRAKEPRPLFPQANVARLHLHAATCELEAALRRPTDRSADHLIPTVRPGSKEEARRRRGPTKRAGLIEEKDLGRILDYIEAKSRSPESDRVKVLLSCKAGLRSGEIATMTYHSSFESEGCVAKNLWVGAGSSKSRYSREVPIHGRLKSALQELHKKYPDAPTVAFSIGRNGRLRPQNAAAVTHWFCQLYKRVGGLAGCSSHSGRRTFATHFARGMSGRHVSLADLQKLLGHRSISSTECYLEPSASVEELINAI